MKLRYKLRLLCLLFTFVLLPYQNVSAFQNL